MQRKNNNRVHIKAGNILFFSPPSPFALDSNSVKQFFFLSEHLHSSCFVPMLEKFWSQPRSNSDQQVLFFVYCSILYSLCIAAFCNNHRLCRLPRAESLTGSGLLIWHAECASDRKPRKAIIWTVEGCNLGIVNHLPQFFDLPLQASYTDDQGCIQWVDTQVCAKSLQWCPTLWPHEL